MKKHRGTIFVLFSMILAFMQVYSVYSVDYKVQSRLSMVYGHLFPKSLGKDENGVFSGLKSSFSCIKLEPVSQTYQKSPEILEKEYGNKYKNLCLLQSLLKNVPGVEVPRLYGLSSTVILDIFSKFAPEIEKLWKELGTLQGSVHELVNSPRVIKNLEIIRAKILELFSSSQVIHFEEGVSVWLTQLLQKDMYLMVRSTGKEDSAINANAGAHESIAYVAPTLQALCGAIGEVVASYFKPEAFIQRIATGENPFVQELFCPVLIQELIGEKLGGADSLEEIPLSGVLFSNEPLYAHDDFKVAVVTASYGHGEGVVANKVASDTFYITTSRATKKLSVLSVVSAKSERLVPERVGTKVVLKERECKKQLSHVPVLSQHMLERLHAVGTLLEKHYSGPRDIEFVVKGDTLYIVQDRPINRKTLMPTYIDVPGDQGISPVVMRKKLTPLVSGQSSVIVITEASQLMCEPDLDTADKKPENMKAAAVIVGQKAKSNSHAAVNFSSRGIPCFYVHDCSEVENLLQNIGKGIVLVVDTQCSELLLWDTKKAAVQTYTKNGWFVHPLPSKLTVQALEYNVAHKSKHRVHKEIEALLQQIGHAESAQALKALARLRIYVNKEVCACTERIHNAYDKIHNADFYSHILQQIKCQVDSLCDELEVHISSGASVLERLYSVKALSAFLLQPTHAYDTELNTYALFSLQDHIAKKELPQNFTADSWLSKYVHYSECALTEDTKNAWHLFLHEVAEMVHPETFKQFVQVLDTLDSLDAVSFWMLAGFDVQRKKHLSAQALCDVLLQEFTQDAVAFLQELKNYKQQLVKYLGAIKIFASPKTVQSAWKSLIDTIVKPCMSDVFINKYSMSSPMVKAIACNFMTTFVNSLDSVIKAMKHSSAFEPQQKVALFAQMLENYAALLDTWALKSGFQSKITYHPSWPLPLYLQKVREAYKRCVFKLTPALLNPSRTFNVQSAMLGSATTFERHYPQTLEDLFTLIHQNLLVVFSAELKASLDMSVLSLPEKMDQLRKEVDAFMWKGIDFSTKATCIGVVITAKQLVLSYNLPLLNHSATFQIVYDKKTKETRFAAQFLGDSRGRWQYIYDALFAFEILCGFELYGKPSLLTSSNDMNGYVTFVWKIFQQTNVSELLGVFIVLANMSFNIPALYVLSPLLNVVGDQKVQKYICEVVNMTTFTTFARDFLDTCIIKKRISLQEIRNIAPLTKSSNPSLSLWCSSKTL